MLNRAWPGRATLNVYESLHVWTYVCVRKLILREADGGNRAWRLTVVSASLVSWWPEDTEEHLCMLCNNSSQEHISLQQMWEATLLVFHCLCYAVASTLAPVQLSTNRENTELQGRRAQPGCLSASHWHLAVVDSLNTLTVVKVLSLFCLSVLKDYGNMAI